MKFPFSIDVPTEIYKKNLKDLQTALYQTLPGLFFTFSTNTHYLDGGKTNRAPYYQEHLFDGTFPAVALKGNYVSFNIFRVGTFSVDPTTREDWPTLVQFGKSEISVVQRNSKGDKLVWTFSDFEPGAPMVQIPSDVMPFDCVQNKNGLYEIWYDHLREEW